ncbi:MAG: nickel-dependent hydrogenase large subunit [Anaerolineae bacterium]
MNLRDKARIAQQTGNAPAANDIYIPVVTNLSESAPGTITIDPVTRLEGHLAVKLDRKDGLISQARATGTLYRGFENMLNGKDMRDASHVTQRICGVCPVAHAQAACLAGEAAAGFTAPANARIVRNLVNGADFLHSHILHFYHLNLMSYMAGPEMPPWTPTYTADMRLNASQTSNLTQHYLQALGARRTAHEMGAILGAKLPHTAVFEMGGVTAFPSQNDLSNFRGRLVQVKDFIDNVYVPDAELLAAVYSDYFQIGRGYSNLLAYGVFDLTDSGSSKLLKRGRVVNGSTAVESVDLHQITEYLGNSWYDGTAANPASGATAPNPDKPDAYSWLKAPRYSGAPYELGPLARMWVNGDYRNGISVMDRHLARAYEAAKIAQAMLGWLDEIQPGQPFYMDYNTSASGSDIGLTEAARGALGHWVTLSAGLVTRYQIITPTCWNCSPSDDSGQPGPLEHALTGAPLVDPDQPVEALRIIHSVDPCLSCAVH